MGGAASAHSEVSQGGGTLQESEKTSYKKPPREKLAELIEKGKVIPDETLGHEHFDNYHNHVKGANRGWWDSASYHGWHEINGGKLAKLKDWDQLDFEEDDAPDPDYVFQYGKIEGTSDKWAKLRPMVIEAQRRMKKEYSAAYKKACQKPGAMDVFNKIIEAKEKKSKQCQRGGAELTMIELFTGAIGSVTDLWEFGERTIQASGEKNVPMCWGIKKPKRIWFKINNKYRTGEGQTDMSQVCDCARISCTFSTAEGLGQAAFYVLKHAVTFKNRIAHPTPEGYRDLMFTVEVNNHVCEVQLHLKEMMNAKKAGAGHKLYKVCRRMLFGPVVTEDTYCAGAAIDENGNEYPEGDGQRDKDGYPHGKGCMFYASGNMYVGQWNHGSKEGKGTMRYVTGNVYNGEFKDNRPHGHGIQDTCTGDQYDGVWDQGDKHGMGTMTYATGNKWVGMWDRSNRHGKGVMYFFDGTVENNVWERGHRAQKERKEYFEEKGVFPPGGPAAKTAKGK